MQPFSLLPLLLPLLLSTLTAASPLAPPAAAPRPLAPPPQPWRDPKSLKPPPQDHKNCKGSGMCPQLASWPCQQAAAQFSDDLVYRKRTSYWYSEGEPGQFWATSKCTAIFVCNDDKDYKDGMSGRQIRLAFDRMWGLNDYKPKKGDKEFFENGKGVGKPCGVCGSSYMVGGCHVTANYCSKCHQSNVELAIPLNPPGTVKPKWKLDEEAKKADELKASAHADLMAAKAKAKEE